MGGGINTAQRVMDCGDAGHILLSRNIAEVLEQFSDWRECLHDLGVQEVKHGVKVHLYNLVKGAGRKPKNTQQTNSAKLAWQSRVTALPVKDLKLCRRGAARNLFAEPSCSLVFFCWLVCWLWLPNSGWNAGLLRRISGRRASSVHLQRPLSADRGRSPESDPSLYSGGGDRSGTRSWFSQHA